MVLSSLDAFAVKILDKNARSMLLTVLAQSNNIEASNHFEVARKYLTRQLEYLSQRGVCFGAKNCFLSSSSRKFREVISDNAAAHKCLGFSRSFSTGYAVSLLRHA